MPILNADYSNIDHEEMSKSIGLKSKHIPILIMSFLEEADPIMSALEESVNTKNYTDIKMNAHTIKGSAGNLRFNEIYEMAKEMEFAGASSDAGFDYNGYLKSIKEAISTIPG